MVDGGREKKEDRRKMEEETHCTILRILICALFVCAGLAFGQDSTQILFQDVAWAPDGNSIYFSAIRHKPDWSDYNDTLWGIYKINSDGTGIKFIGKRMLFVAANPDGKTLAAGFAMGMLRHIVTIDSAGQVTDITAKAGIGDSPAWSPDGKQLCFTSIRNGTRDIFICDRDGSNIRKLTSSDGAKPFNPQWSPDGKHILYFLDKGDRKDQVYVIPVEGGKATNLTRDTLLNIYPGWRPDGKIIYSRLTHKSAEIVVTDLKGKSHKVVPHIASNFARVSPDGKQIAFTSSEQGLCVCDLKGKNIRIVTNTITR